MLEVGKWLVLGGFLGFIAQWAFDTRTLQKLKATLPDPDRLQDLETENRILSAHRDQNAELQNTIDQQAATIADLQKQLQERPNTPPEQSPKSTTPTAPVPTLHDLEGPTPDQIQKLEQSGIATLADLAAKTEEEVLAALEAQPWDMVDPAPWIAQARTLLQTNAPENPGPSIQTPTQSSADDLTKIEGLEPDHAHKLLAAGIDTFAKLAAKAEEEILEIIEAQPWDMVDVPAWLTQAEQLAP